MACSYVLFTPFLVASVSAFQLANIIADHMVLPRAPLKANVWGTATPQSTITVTLDNGKAYQGQADKHGDWLVELDPQNAGTDRHMTISGEGHEVTLQDLAFGDVWICGGQSNMRIGLSLTLDAEQKIAERSKYKNLRVVAQKPTQCHVPQRDLKFARAESEECNIDSGVNYLWTSVAAEKGYPNGFSGVCYNFGTEVYSSLNGEVPIGLISFYRDGTTIQEFMSPDALGDNTCGGLHPVGSQLISKRSWRLELGAVTGSLCYNGMIHPLLNVRPAGMVWYQGEQNRYEAEAYECMFPAFIQDLRRKFKREDMDFLYVQLAAHDMDRHGELVLPWIRQAQQKALELPNVGFASAIDQGDHVGGIHPKRKSEIGRRLGLKALHMHYGKEDAGAGPTATNIERNDSQDVVINFEESTAQGLHAVDAADCGHVGTKSCCKESPFEAMTTIDGKETWTRVSDWKVVGNTVALKGVASEATAIRFDWESYPQCVLLNGEGGPDDHKGIVAPPFLMQMDGHKVDQSKASFLSLRGVAPQRPL